MSESPDLTAAGAVEDALPVLARKTPLAQYNPANPFLATIEEAIANNIGAEELNRLLDAAERVDTKLAKQAFTAALTAFQDECPCIPKSSTAKIVTQKGTYAYDYPALEECERIALPLLHKHGFVKRHGSVTLDGPNLTASCILEHSEGHTDETFYTLSIESRAGMSAAQKGGAAETYAKRRAFINAAGLRIGGEDTDGGENAEPVETIDAQQAMSINDLIIQATDGVEGAVTNWKTRIFGKYGIDALEQLPADKFDEVAAKIQGTIDPPSLQARLRRMASPAVWDADSVALRPDPHAEDVEACGGSVPVSLRAVCGTGLRPA
jgi:hypothetical protein